MTALHLQPIKPARKVYREAVSQLVELMRSGALQPGDKLPSETELARMLGVSRPSVREALRALELLGAIECRPGSGNYIVDRTGEAWSDEIIGELLIVGGPQDVQDARWYIEIGAVELCAERRTAEDLAKLYESAQRFEDSLRTGIGATALGLEFHQLIARGSHNMILAMAIDLIMERMRKRVWQYYEHALCADPIHTPSHIEHHWQIYRAIEQGDARQAVQAMRVHLRCLDADLSGRRTPAAPGQAVESATRSDDATFVGRREVMD